MRIVITNSSNPFHVASWNAPYSSLSIGHVLPVQTLFVIRQAYLGMIRVLPKEQIRIDVKTYQSPCSFSKTSLASILAIWHCLVRKCHPLLKQFGKPACCYNLIENSDPCSRKETRNSQSLILVVCKFSIFSSSWFVVFLHLTALESTGHNSVILSCVLFSSLFHSMSDIKQERIFLHLSLCTLTC